MKTAFLVLGGAAVGGIIGWLGFLWMAKQGFYALVLPGGLAGLGAGMPRNRSVALAVACGVMALAFGLFTEWRFAPFQKDGSLWFFLQHVGELPPVTLLMISAGAFIGFWIPFRRISK